MTKEAFIGNLPHRPYCTDDTSSGLFIRPQTTALGYRHIQYNPPPHVASLVFDLDKPDSYHAWQDAGLPAPHCNIWKIQLYYSYGSYHHKLR
jgi:hypothetical protein